jgi:hypothetical protein
MRRRGIRHRKRRKMDASVARQRRIQLAAERRIGGLEQHFDVAAREHGRHVAGAGGARRALGFGNHLNGNWCRSKSGARERAARGVRIAHEMADMVEENLVEDGKLAVHR